MSLALVLLIFRMNSWKQREAGWFVKAEEAEIMPRLELNVWFLFWKAIVPYKIPALSLFLAVVIALGRFKNDALLNI